MRKDSIEDFLDRLAAKIPAPGGGAVAALHAAQGAALLAMVARYSEGAKYAAHAEVIASVLADAEELRERSLANAESDVAAFTAVTVAYRLAQDTEAARAERARSIAAALAGAARPPAAVIGTASRLVELAEDLLPVGNLNVITDVAAAAEAARAAATTARVNIEVNLGGMTDPEVVAEFTAIAGLVDGIVARAEQVTAAVRQEIAR
jgi:formiminotetrahydrofolate cyclodeaminase